MFHEECQDACRTILPIDEAWRSFKNELSSPNPTFNDAILWFDGRHPVTSSLGYMRQLAAHEAGHAVAALMLKIPFTHMTIEHSIDHIEGYIHLVADDLVTPEDRETSAVITAAGREAEQLLGYAVWEQNEMDDLRMMLLGFPPTKKWPWSSYACFLLSSKINAVERIADSLWMKWRLSFDEAQSIFNEASSG